MTRLIGQGIQCLTSDLPKTHSTLWKAESSENMSSLRGKNKLILYKVRRL